MWTPFWFMVPPPQKITANAKKTVEFTTVRGVVTQYTEVAGAPRPPEQLRGQSESHSDQCGVWDSESETLRLGADAVSCRSEKGLTLRRSRIILLIGVRGTGSSVN